MHELIIGGNRYTLPGDFLIRTFDDRDRDIRRFSNAKRKTPVTELILHETVTVSWMNTVSVLFSKKLGVHLIVDHDGTVYQHGDLATDLLWHASEHNAQSIGIEVVTPYEPRFMPAKGPWSETIEAPWAAGPAGRYVVPTLAQCESVALLTKWLTDDASKLPASRLAIPQRWPGLQGTRRLAVRRILDGVVPHPGTLAHCNFEHNDGTFLVLYSWLRIEPGLSPKEAYNDAKQLLTGARDSVDLDDYFVRNPYIQDV